MGHIVHVVVHISAQYVSWSVEMSTISPTIYAKIDNMYNRRTVNPIDFKLGILLNIH